MAFLPLNPELQADIIAAIPICAAETAHATFLKIAKLCGVSLSTARKFGKAAYDSHCADVKAFGCDDILEIPNQIEDYAPVANFDSIPKMPINFVPETSADYEIEHAPALNSGDIEIDPERRMVELVSSDWHLPYENRAALALFFDVAEDLQPDVICLLGDIMDCYAVSAHDKDADRATPQTFKDELDYTKTKLTELRRLCPNARIIYKEGNHECFDTETEMLTAEGWKRQETLTENDLVGSYNQQTNQIEFAKPISIYRGHYQGEMLKISARHSDLLITPNHRLLFAYNTPQQKWQIKPANEIHKGNNRIVFQVSSESLKPEYDILDGEIKIAAWLLTDGGLKGTCPIIYQRISKVHLITDILDSLKWTYTRTERQRDVQQVCSRKLISTPELSVELRLTGEAHQRARKLVKDKNGLPEWVFNLSQRQFDLFLQSYIDGDGSRHPSAPETSLMVYGQAPLLDDLQRACLVYGYRSSLSEYRAAQLRLNITKNTHFALDGFGNYCTQEQYDGLIWCVTTENDTCIVRRNGKISITGNTRLSRYINKNAAVLSKLKCITLPSLLGLDELNIEWLSDKQRFRMGKLHKIHGHEIGGSGMSPARTKYSRMQCNFIFGHLHIEDKHRARAYDGSQHGAYANPCLCDLEPEYLHHNGWSNGFAKVDFEADGTFQLDQINIIQNGSKNPIAKCQVSGKTYGINLNQRAVKI